jgi:hypothetical protein
MVSSPAQPALTQGDRDMHTMMIISMDQGKGLTEDALRPVPLFDLAERLGAALIAFARWLGTSPALRSARA